MDKIDLLVDTNTNRKILKTIIAADRKISVRELGEKLSMNERTVRSNLKVLDTEGFIYSVIDKTDGGRKCLHFRSIYKPREIGKILVVS